jgi:release factor glutamine methyltransferase
MNIIRNNIRKLQEFREIELKKHRDSQPYELLFDGLKIVVEKDVFPPDLGYTSFMLAEEISKYKVDNALDMGCGTGLLSLLMIKNGCRKVVAVDIHKPAIKCTFHNVNLNKLSQKIFIIHSDLFSKVPFQHFDLIVFNQPYYPSTGIFGHGNNGGKEIITKFFQQVKMYLSETGFIIMPYSTLAGIENNPSKIAKKAGFNSEVLIKKKDFENTHIIYSFRL